MRKVDENIRPAEARQVLQPAAHPRQRRQPRGDDGHGHAQELCAFRRRHGVVHVVQPRHVQADVVQLVEQVDDEAAAFKIFADIDGEHVGGVFQCVGEGVFAAGGELAPFRVVGVQDAEAAAPRLKQPLFGGGVFFHGREKVEVVFGEVGEDARFKGDAVRLAEVQGVGGNFHDGVFHPRLRHVRQHLVQEGGVGRGQLGGYLAVGVADAQRADDAAALARPREDGNEHVRRGRLAVGARDADRLQLALGVPVQRRRRFRYRLPAVFDDQLGNVEGKFALHHQRRRPARQRLGGEVVPVVLAAREADEQVAAQDVLAVRADAGDLRLAEVRFSFVTDLCR